GHRPNTITPFKVALLIGISMGKFFEKKKIKVITKNLSSG
ncbi:3588_t:CDS:2, partial [Dentiscutata erythropus]